MDWIKANQIPCILFFCLYPSAGHFTVLVWSASAKLCSTLLYSVLCSALLCTALLLTTIHIVHIQSLGPILLLQPKAVSRSRCTFDWTAGQVTTLNLHFHTTPLRPSRTFGTLFGIYPNRCCAKNKPSSDPSNPKKVDI